MEERTHFEGFENYFKRFRIALKNKLRCVNRHNREEDEREYAQALQNALYVFVQNQAFTRTQGDERNQHKFQIHGNAEVHSPKHRIKEERSCFFAPKTDTRKTARFDTVQGVEIHIRVAFYVFEE